MGTTSACAENTLILAKRDRSRGNYLRVRGEYTLLPAAPTPPPELPPRARRIPYRSRPILPAIGTTSACAENTEFLAIEQVEAGNYLRVRGEYPK